MYDPLPVVSGNPKNRAEILFTENTALIHLTIRRYFPFLSPTQKDDAESYARTGLWRACQLYDPAKGYTFSTYATRTIRGYVFHYLRREKFQGRLPTVSLQTPIGEDGAETLEGMLADDHDFAEALTDAAGFEGLIAGLPRRHQRLLRAVYEDGETFADIAREMGQSQAATSNLHRRALDLLRG